MIWDLLREQVYGYVWTPPANMDGDLKRLVTKETLRGIALFYWQYVTMLMLVFGIVAWVVPELATMRWAAAAAAFFYVVVYALLSHLSFRYKGMRVTYTGVIAYGKAGQIG